MTVTAAHRRVVRPVPAGDAAPTTVRVALYTRKSSEKGMEQAFNSIDAQRQMLQEYVARHAEAGWVALPDRYDDGGFTGGNTKRPAFQRLLADILAGRIDKVAVYRLDRLSRSTGDFDSILQTFRDHGIEAVSPNERIEHATAGDRLNVGIRMQVSQFEREVAAERIRDKMRAARGQGLWQGGRPILGFDVIAKRLVVNEIEAGDVRAIFEAYLRTKSIVTTLGELGRRGIRNKSWTTQKGRTVEGRAFDANTLRNLLGNVLYAGQIHAGDAVVPGQQPAVVPAESWDAVQALLDEARTTRTRERQPTGALLQGLLRCARCDGTMVPHYTVKNSRRYASYVCSTMKRRGVTACQGSRAPLGPMEAFVVERVRELSRDPDLVQRILAAAGPELATRCAEVAQDVRRAGVELKRARAAGDPGEMAARRSEELREESAALKHCTIDENELRDALVSIDAVWDALFSAERSRLLHLLIAGIVYDAEAERAVITVRTADGETTVAHDVAFRRREGSALVAVARHKALHAADVAAAPPAAAPDDAASSAATDAYPTARLLALAHRIERLVDAGELRDYREAAVRFGISHARMSQITGMLLLAPSIQAAILLGRVDATEGGLRRLVAMPDWSAQSAAAVPEARFRARLSTLAPAV
jgi:site-specific DNA recombinase